MIEIKIAGDTADDVLAELAKLAEAAGLTAAPATEIPAPTAAPTPATVEPEPEMEPGTPDPAPAVPEDDEPAPEPEGEEPPAKPLTLEEVRKAGVEAARAHGKPAVHAILKELDAPGMTALSPEQYPEFMRKLGELNAE